MIMMLMMTTMMMAIIISVAPFSSMLDRQFSCRARPAAH